MAPALEHQHVVGALEDVGVGAVLQVQAAPHLLERVVLVLLQPLRQTLPELGEAARTALEQRGFSVVLTSSGKRALTLARQEQPNLILLDLKLPGMDGYEVLQRLKRMPETAEIPVMVITGSLTDEELKQQKLLSLGASRFMTKPFAVDELVNEIGLLVMNRTLAEPASQS